jgi:hypothetical protein
VQPVTDICDLDLEAPDRFDLSVADVTAPLLAGLSQAALDLAQARAEARGWRQHAALLAEQVKALKARGAELTQAPQKETA